MSTSILVCDDSNIARRQIAKLLPADLDARISFASNGKEGLNAIRAGFGDVVFMDLNMSVMDGFEVLEYIREHELSTSVFVVSSDIQPETKERVMNMGALAFIKKPVDDASVILQMLEQCGLHRGQGMACETTSPAWQDVSDKDCYQEIANVAMGRSADLLARLLHVFVVMSLPKVKLLNVSELQMVLSPAAHEDTFSAVSQGFIGHGIAGEMLLIMHDSSFSDIARLMKFRGEINETAELELIIDIASVMIGSFLKGVAEQLDVSFSQGHPIVLGQHVKIADLVQANVCQSKKTLTIEVSYTIENHNIHCDLLMLLTEDSIKAIQERFSYLRD